jgi:hypothetical protein
MKNPNFLMLIDIERIQKIEKSLNKKYQLIFNLLIKHGLILTHIKNLTPAHLLEINNLHVLKLVGFYKTRYISCPPDLFRNLKSYIAEKKIKKNQKIFPLSRQAIFNIFKARGITPSTLRKIYILTSTSRSIKIHPDKEFF